MLRIEVTHTFDVSVAQAFAYITDMKNWPEYRPGFHSHRKSHCGRLEQPR